MSLPSLRVTVDGLPLTEIAAHTPPVIETFADGGCGSLFTRLEMSPKRTHHLLYPGALVRCFLGLRPLFSGRLGEPDRSTWELRAVGHSAHARALVAMDSGGNSTRNAATALSTARTAWNFAGTDPTGVMAGIASGNSTGIQPLGTLFDQLAEQQGKRWGIDARTRLYLRADPTSPNMLLAPEVAALGQTSEGAPSNMAGRYIDATTGQLQTAFWPIGNTVTQIKTVDLTPRGQLSLTQANAILGGMLALSAKRAAWNSGMTVHQSQLHFNGVEPFLPTMRAGEVMLQLVGMPAAFAAGTTQVSVVGKTKWDAATPDYIYLEPVNAAPRDAVEVWAA